MESKDTVSMGFTVGVMAGGCWMGWNGGKVFFKPAILFRVLEIRNAIRST